jgi:hypothetical protein
MDDGGAVLAGGGMLCFIGFMILLSLVTFTIWVWALVDAIKNPRLSDNERILWVVVILMTHCLGALIYVVVGRNK